MSGGNSEPLYNTDTLNKACISTRILTSPQRYSVMRSRVPRLRESGIRAPLADYDTDTAHKKYLTSSVRDSRIRYAATFSNSGRFARDIKTAAPDVTYDTDVLSNSQANNFASGLAKTPITYKNVRSRRPRKGPEIITEAPDIMYDVDTLNKATLRAIVDRSPRKMSTMTSTSARFGIPMRPSTEPEVGPGYYAYTIPTRREDVDRELSSFRSTAARFDRRVDPSRGLGSTWHPEKDRKYWNRGGFTISTTQMTRPSYLPSSYSEKK